MNPFLVIPLVFSVLTGCVNDSSPLPPDREYGESPQLAEPETGALPTIHPAKAIGWPEGTMPRPASGLTVTAFARELKHPRWLFVLPNGDVLVAESNKPKTESAFSGIKGWIADWMMAYAGAGVPSADRITLLRDSDADGIADVTAVFLDNLNSPFGMALLGNHLYVANADSLMRFPYSTGSRSIDAPGERVTALPGKTLNHHWTKNVIADEASGLLYVAVGSNSNIGENGMDQEVDRAAILQINPDTGESVVYASGLRNPVGMAWEPETGQLWTVVNERDELGDQLVPDYLTEVVEGAFYGWPYSYWGDIVDTRVSPQRPDLVAIARKPDYALGAHTASLGLAFYDRDSIDSLRGSAIIGQHGSWNRNPPSGYKVIAVPFRDGKPNGAPQDLLTGFLNDNGEAYGRPVGVAVDQQGGILVADDAGNAIWRLARGGDAL